MVNSAGDFAANDEPENSAAVAEASVARAAPPTRTSKSMHEGVAVWCDCCSCAAEPYWVAVAEEMGIDLGSDYEDVTVMEEGAKSVSRSP